MGVKPPLALSLSKALSKDLNHSATRLKTVN